METIIDREIQENPQFGLDIYESLWISYLLSRGRCRDTAEIMTILSIDVDFDGIDFPGFQEWFSPRVRRGDADDVWDEIYEGTQ